MQEVQQGAMYTRVAVIREGPAALSNSASMDLIEEASAASVRCATPLAGVPTPRPDPAEAAALMADGLGGGALDSTDSAAWQDVVSGLQSATLRRACGVGEGPWRSLGGGERATMLNAAQLHALYARKRHYKELSERRLHELLTAHHGSAGGDALHTVRSVAPEASAVVAQLSPGRHVRPSEILPSTRKRARLLQERAASGRSEQLRVASSAGIPPMVARSARGAVAMAPSGRRSPARVASNIGAPPIVAGSERSLRSVAAPAEVPTKEDHDLHKVSTRTGITPQGLPSGRGTSRALFRTMQRRSRALDVVATARDTAARELRPQDRRRRDPGALLREGLRREEDRVVAVEEPKATYARLPPQDLGPKMADVLARAAAASAAQRAFERSASARLAGAPHWFWQRSAVCVLRAEPAAALVALRADLRTVARVRALDTAGHGSLGLGPGYDRCLGDALAALEAEPLYLNVYAGVGSAVREGDPTPVHATPILTTPTFHYSIAEHRRPVQEQLEARNGALAQRGATLDELRRHAGAPVLASTPALWRVWTRDLEHAFGRGSSGVVESPRGVLEDVREALQRWCALPTTVRLDDLPAHDSAWGLAIDGARHASGDSFPMAQADSPLWADAQPVLLNTGESPAAYSRRLARALATTEAEIAHLEAVWRDSPFLQRLEAAMQDAAQDAPPPRSRALDPFSQLTLVKLEYLGQYPDAEHGEVLAGLRSELGLPASAAPREPPTTRLAQQSRAVEATLQGRSLTYTGGVQVVAAPSAVSAERRKLVCTVSAGGAVTAPTTPNGACPWCAMPMGGAIPDISAPPCGEKCTLVSAYETTEDVIPTVDTERTRTRRVAASNRAGLARRGGTGSLWIANARALHAGGAALLHVGSRAWLQASLPSLAHGAALHYLLRDKRARRAQIRACRHEALRFRYARAVTARPLREPASYLQGAPRPAFYGALLFSDAQQRQGFVPTHQLDAYVTFLHARRAALRAIVGDHAPSERDAPPHVPHRIEAIRSKLHDELPLPPPADVTWTFVPFADFARARTVAAIKQSFSEMVSGSREACADERRATAVEGAMPVRSVSPGPAHVGTSSMEAFCGSDVQQAGSEGGSNSSLQVWSAEELSSSGVSAHESATLGAPRLAEFAPLDLLTGRADEAERWVGGFSPGADPSPTSPRAGAESRPLGPPMPATPGTPQARFVGTHADAPQHAPESHLPCRGTLKIHKSECRPPVQRVTAAFPLAASQEPRRGGLPWPLESPASSASAGSIGKRPVGERITAWERRARRVERSRERSALRTQIN